MATHDRPVADDRDARPAPDVQDPRQGRRRGRPRRRPRGRRGRDLRLPRPERGRQDDDPADARDAAHADLGEATVAGADLRTRAAAGPRADRLRAAGRLDRPGRDRPRRARHPGPPVRHGQGERRSARASEVLAALDLEAAADRAIAHVLGRHEAPARCRPRASSIDRPSCSSTSRRPGSTRRRARGCGTRSAASARAGTTVFLTTHYLEEADALADRLAIIDHGRIVAEGTADELKRQVAGDVITHRRRRRRRARPRGRPRPAVRARGERARTSSSGSTSTRATSPSRSSSASSTAPGCAPGV